LTDDSLESVTLA